MGTPHTSLNRIAQWQCFFFLFYGLKCCTAAHHLPVVHDGYPVLKDRLVVYMSSSMLSHALCFPLSRASFSSPLSPCHFCLSSLALSASASTSTFSSFILFSCLSGHTLCFLCLLGLQQPWHSKAGVTFDLAFHNVQHTLILSC